MAPEWILMLLTQFIAEDMSYYQKRTFTFLNELYDAPNLFC